MQAVHSRVVFGAIAIGMALSACVSTPPAPELFDLRVEPVTPATRPRDVQLLVSLPEAIDAVNTDRIVVRVPSGQGIAYLPDARWADRLPALVGTRLADRLNLAHVVRGIGAPGDGLSIDNRLLVEISRFELETSGTPMVDVQLNARLVNDHTGKVIGSANFPAEVAVASAKPSDVAAGFEQAFNRVTADLTDWVGKTADAK